MKRKEVALVTYKRKPGLSDGDSLLIKPMKEAGFDAVAVPWDRKKVDWSSFEVVVIRSCWDYHKRVDEFYEWLEQLETSGVRVFNPLNIIRWNADKHYLEKFISRGISVIPTHFVNQGETYDLREILARLDRPEIIVKPTFGASADGVRRIRRHDLKKIERAVQNVLRFGDAMIQPYLSEIKTGGEYSFVFFGKKFSHAIIKKPAINDFRTQPNFGGSESVVEVGLNFINQAQQIINEDSGPLLYARVDGIMIEGKLQLMELELIEPYLFFEFEPSAAQKFVQAMVDLM